MGQIFLSDKNTIYLSIIIFNAISWVLSYAIISEKYRNSAFTIIIPLMRECRTVTKRVYFSISKCLRILKAFVCEHGTVNSSCHITVIIQPGNTIGENCFIRKTIIYPSGYRRFLVI